jgi:membrane protease YdiL (CAAX protease family)
MGLILGVVYVWRGSLVAPVVMHFVQDFATIVLLPVLVRR